MSKGSGRRPTDEDVYKSNYDAIFGKKTPADDDQQKHYGSELDWDKLKPENRAQGHSCPQNSMTHGG